MGAAAPQIAAADPAAAVTAPAEEGPKIGPMVSLDALTVSAGDAALSSGATPASVTTSGAAVTIVRRLSGETGAAAPAGRADDYSWPATP